MKNLFAFPSKYSFDRDIGSYTCINASKFFKVFKEVFERNNNLLLKKTLPG